jgi:hypothetical protein
VGGQGWYSRYEEAQRRRTLSALTNPLGIGATMVLTRIFCRWWPATLFTAWSAFCVGSALRIRSRDARRSGRAE